MNISWEWLIELVDLSNIKPEDLAEKLTLAGLEVENISDNSSKNIILEISTTANRGDTLSVIGIAREISAVLDRPLIFSQAKLPLHMHHQNIVKNDHHHSYSIRGSITNIRTTHTPKWLKQRLKVSNIEPSNILEDIQNFIYLKWAQHIDFFDLDSLSCNNSDALYTGFKTGFGTLNEPFLTKEGQLITDHTCEIITINNSKKPIALAGITTRAEYAANPKTTNLLLQISKFNSKFINQATQTLNLDTNNSHIHKKDLKTIDLLDAYSECVFLITSLCLGSVQNTVYMHRNNCIYPYIKLSTQEIVSTLGPNFIKKNNNLTSVENLYINIFKKLRFIIWIKTKYLIIETPLDRIQDVSRGIDLIEEVSRIYGFNKFNGTIPYYKEYGLKGKQHNRIAHIRSVLRTVGLSEVIHSSLVESKYIEPIVCNPVIKECNAIRSSLIPSIISTYAYNLQQGNSSIEIFEIGRVFKYKNSNYEEAIHLAGIIGKGENIRAKWQDNLRGLSWFEAKGIMEEVFERLGATILWKPLDLSLDLYKELKPYFSTASTSTLYCQNEIIGLFGTLRTSEVKISISDKNIYGFEIFIDKINYKLANTRYFKSYTKYPAITRDVTMTIPHNISFDTVMNKISHIKNPLVESVNLLNLYRNETQYGKFKRLGFRIKYRSSSGTLASETIDNIENTLKTTISQTFTN